MRYKYRIVEGSDSCISVFVYVELVNFYYWRF